MASENTNRGALRRLSQRIPHPLEAIKALENLRSNTEYEAVILASALLEAKLETLLIKNFKSKDPNLIGQIFSSNGALSDFNSKIQMAQAVGIINSASAKDLNTIRIIRNTFAHSKRLVSLNNELILREIRSTESWGILVDVIIENHGESERSKILDMDAKSAFLIVTYLADVMMGHPPEYEEPAEQLLTEKGFNVPELLASLGKFARNPPSRPRRKGDTQKE